MEENNLKVKSSREARQRQKSQQEEIDKLRQFLSELDLSYIGYQNSAVLIMNIDELVVLTKEEILDINQKYWRLKAKYEEDKNQLEKDIWNIFYNSDELQKIKMSLLQEEDDLFVNNFLYEEDFKQFQDLLMKWRMEEAVKMKTTLKNALMIHLDVKRAFDNLKPELLFKMLEFIKKEDKFSFLHPYLNIIRKWISVIANEKLKIEGCEEFERTIGGPQGSLWMPAIWNMYVALILKNSPLKNMIKIYADNIFLWLPEEKVTKNYLEKALKIIKLNLKMADLTINEDEIMVFWYDRNKKYYDVCSKLFKIKDEQRILGFNFGLEDYTWSFRFKFYLPKPEKLKIKDLSFREKLTMFKQKGIASMYYQMQGFFIFGNYNKVDSYDWNKIDSLVRISFTKWTGLFNVSYWDLGALGLLPRHHLVDKLTLTMLVNYRENEKTWNKNSQIGAHKAWEDIALHIAYRFWDDTSINNVENHLKIIKEKDSFINRILNKRELIIEWIEDLTRSIKKSKYHEYKDLSMEFKEFHLSSDMRDVEKNIGVWMKMANHYRLYDLRRRNKDLFNIDNLNKQVKWDLRLYWYIYLNKVPIYALTKKLVKDLKQFLDNTIPLPEVFANLLGKKLKRPSTWKKPELSNNFWIILDKICEMVEVNNKSLEKIKCVILELTRETTFLNGIQELLIE